MSEVTMLSNMIRRWILTFSRGGSDGSILRLVINDHRLDTDAVYTCDRAQGASTLIARAYADYVAEYGEAVRS